jgi:hypothetical protein
VYKTSPDRRDELPTAAEAALLQCLQEAGRLVRQVMRDCTVCSGDVDEEGYECHPFCFCQDLLGFSWGLHTMRSLLEGARVWIKVEPGQDTVNTAADASFSDTPFVVEGR